MRIETHHRKDKQIAEVVSDVPVIRRAQDGIDLLGNLYFQGFDGVILQQQQIAPSFFDLRTGMAGEILQKFSNYRMQLAIVGDFSAYESKSLRDFIFESNKGTLVNFCGTVEEALERLGR